MIFVLDFGSQYSHLITRRIRELGVYAELVAPNFPLEKLKNADGIILSGGPQNLSDSNALRVDKKIYSLGIPILGICYGMQLTAYELGGRVKAGKKREYGPTEIKITKADPLFRGLKPRQMTWMSHGDQVVKMPKGYVKIAESLNCPISAMANVAKKIYGLQFHPEVMHTTNGTKILENFLKITGAQKTWFMKDFVKHEIAKIKQQAGSDKVICALSGGVDSAVAAEIVRRAVGKNLTCIFVDTGLMREGEAKQIRKVFRNSPNPSYPKRGTPPLKLRGGREGLLNLKVMKAQKEFLRKLKGVTDPEKKRKIIGELFIRIFEREARKIKNARWLVQGTLYTDAVTSGVSIGGKHTAVIKSHHNVGGLPKKMGLKLIEPLRELYKDEVRKIGKILGLPKSIVYRQPFPGPGLAVRIIGKITEERLDLLRRAESIVSEEIEKNGVKIQQYFAVLPIIRSVGVQGDARTYGHPIIVRAITTPDLMTAHWAKLPYSLLEKISNRITNEIPGINRVVYDITSKPPATVEWE